jgi:uncharacterized protein (DUF58 family)
VVLLDARLAAHRGDGPASSLEWAVSAAASIGLHLAHRGYDVRLVTDTGGEVSSASLGANGFGNALLDTLAGLTPSTGQTLQPGVDAARHAGGQGLIVAVVGDIHADDADRLARLRAADRSTGVLMVLDTPSWAGGPASPYPRREHVLGALSAAGWRVVEVRRGQSVAASWAAVDGRASAAALAATVTGAAS